MKSRLSAPPLAVAMLALALSPFANFANEEVSFSTDIRPILADKCFHCHGHDKESRKAKLRLDTKDGALAAIVPGKPLESEVYLRIITDDPDEIMPEPDSGKTLDATQKDLIKRWIEQGAPWEDHWAFQPPHKPKLPRTNQPDWPKNEVDHFVLAGLDAHDLKPAPEADKRRLIRRVTFDLTGLPPTPEAVAAFLADTRPDAYERLVDSLLSSQQYGVHMARYWLDLVRYGDTHGLHLDNYREMWPYRDWVVDAYNANMPFDQFTLEQIAGDLLPKATLEQKIASGYNRCHVTTAEGGSIKEEVYVRNVIDRVETTTAVFMGLSGGCAVCHDHKFDPLTMKDFYSMFAFFNSLDGDAMDGNKKDHAPVVQVFTAEQKAETVKLDGELADLAKQMAACKKAGAAEFEKWALQTMKPEELLPVDPILHLPLDGQAGGKIEGYECFVDGKVDKAFKFNGQTYVDLGDVGAFERDQAFSYGCWVKTAGKINGTPIARMEDNNGHRGWDLYINQKKVAMHLINHWPNIALKVTTKKDVLKPNQWHHVFVTYDGSAKQEGAKIYIDGKVQPHNANNNNLTDTTITKVPLQLGRRNPGSPFSGEVDEVFIYDRLLTPQEVAQLAGADPIGPILATAPDRRTKKQKDTLRTHYFASIDPAHRDLTREHKKLQARRDSLNKGTVTTLVFKEMAKPRDAFMLERGQYDAKGDKMSRRTPEFLPPMKNDMPRNRIGFAQWLLAPEHPLTARVAANRHWQQLFGVGLVKTAEDFGNQGEPPSHPRLLDWLAVQYRESGWDTKALMKLLVTSATYRQSTEAPSETYHADRENRLLARGPRFRLDAEMLRDQALAVSGLLNQKVGGPSVKPPQPDGLWYAVGYTRSNTARFQRDTGDDKVYRRSVYTFWKRTAPPPQLATFDAPSRENCTPRRERTNTPLQALVMLNEQQYIEAARGLAVNSYQAANSANARARTIFQRATTRPPTAEEEEELVGTFHALFAEFSQDEAAAKNLLCYGDHPADPKLPPAELAAWTMVASTVLNLDEVLNKE
jgi:hypothetical protein